MVSHPVQCTGRDHVSTTVRCSEGEERKTLKGGSLKISPYTDVLAYMVRHQRGALIKQRLPG